MYKVKTLNNISPSAKEVLNENEYEMSDTVADPDALFVRASDLHDYPWTDNIKCIGRAGIGVNGSTAIKENMDQLKHTWKKSRSSLLVRNSMEKH